MATLINRMLPVILSVSLAFIILDDHPAIRFIHSLDPDQKTKILLPFDDTSKTSWHFIPSSMWQRAGIQLADLNANQKELFFELLHSSLSESGYLKTTKIIGLENVLLEQSGDSVMRGPEKYFVAMYGNPEKDSLWAWSFEGHHISLNFTVLNGKTSIAPRFLGANPAMITSGPRKGERTLAREEDFGFELIHSLSSDQLNDAIFQDNAFYEIVTSNAPEVSPLDPVGIRYDELTDSQQSVLLELINEYLATMPLDLAVERMEKLKNEEMGAIRFGWAGATHSGEGHYYRVQGKSFLIEFDNTQNNANHIHSVWRDYTGDFGKDLIRLHYMHSEHHQN